MSKLASKIHGWWFCHRHCYRSNLVSTQFFVYWGMGLCRNWSSSCSITSCNDLMSHHRGKISPFKILAVNICNLKKAWDHSLVSSPRRINSIWSRPNRPITQKWKSKCSRSSATWGWSSPHFSSTYPSNVFFIFTSKSHTNHIFPIEKASWKFNYRIQHFYDNFLYSLISLSTAFIFLTYAYSVEVTISVVALLDHSRFYNEFMNQVDMYEIFNMDI